MQSSNFLLLLKHVDVKAFVQTFLSSYFIHYWRIYSFIQCCEKKIILNDENHISIMFNFFIALLGKLWYDFNFEAS